MQVIVSRHVRDDVLHLVVRILRELDGLSAEDRLLQCRSLLALDRAGEVAEIVSELIEDGDKRQFLLALQICFDLFDHDVYVRPSSDLLAKAMFAICMKAVTATGGVAVGSFGSSCAVSSTWQMHTPIGSSSARSGAVCRRSCNKSRQS